MGNKLRPGTLCRKGDGGSQNRAKSPLILFSDRYSCLKQNKRVGRNVLNCPITATFKLQEINLQYIGLFFLDSLSETNEMFPSQASLLPYMKMLSQPSD